MLYDYIAILFFAAFAIFIPVSFLFASRLLRKQYPGNKVKNAPYESGENTVGRSRDIDTEYISFFALFLPFEMVAVIMLLYSINILDGNYYVGLSYILLTVISLGFSLIGYKLINDKHAGK